MTDTKTCSTCKQELPLDRFYKRKKGYYESQCNPCRAAASKAKRATLPTQERKVPAKRFYTNPLADLEYTDQFINGQRVVLVVSNAAARGFVALPHEKGMDWTKRYEGDRVYWARICTVCEQVVQLERFRHKTSNGSDQISTICDSCEQAQHRARKRKAA